MFLNLSIEMYASCHHRCVMESDCVSVNIGPPINDKVVCELSNSDHWRRGMHSHLNGNDDVMAFVMIILMRADGNE